MLEHSLAFQTPPCLHEISTPSFYKYVDHFVLSTVEFDICHPSIAKEIVIIRFETGDLTDPRIVPVCVYYRDGVKHYLWNNKYWAEMDITGCLRKIRDQLGHKVRAESIHNVAIDDFMHQSYFGHDIIHQYRSGYDSTASTHSGMVYTRSIYEVNV